MDKNTLSNYGWVVIVVIVLALMITLASPFGNYVADGASNILEGFSDSANIAVDAGTDEEIGSGDVTYYTVEQIDADDHLFGVGSGSGESKTNHVVAKFNADYSEVVITKNGDESLGLLARGTTDEPNAYLKGVTSLVIKPGIVNIPATVFNGSTTLKAVSIPNTVTKIYDNAFYECSALESVDIPGSVKSIGNSAFQKCTTLSSVTLNNGLETIGDKVFQNCKVLTSIDIPDSVTSLGNWVFVNCYALESVTLSNNITSIKEKTFMSCTSLTNITIPGKVTSIGTQAFGYCSKLESIAIPSSVTTIADDAFVNCSKLTTIYGAAGSYAETWATTNGYTFVEN